MPSANSLSLNNVAFLGATSGGIPPAGTLLGTSCDGTTLMGSYADGVGGSYLSMIETNSTDCGYTPPPLYGTFLSSYCDGTTLIGTYADGSGGAYTNVIE